MRGDRCSPGHRAICFQRHAGHRFEPVSGRILARNTFSQLPWGHVIRLLQRVKESRRPRVVCPGVHRGLASERFVLNFGHVSRICERMRATRRQRSGAGGPRSFPALSTGRPSALRAAGGEPDGGRRRVSGDRGGQRQRQDHLLSLLSGLDKPSQGRVLVEGRDITAVSEDGLAPLRNRTFGFVFQSFHLIPALSAIENISLPAELAGAPAPSSGPER